MKKKLRIQNGTAVVEFAVILPLLVVIAFGIIEFSILLYDKSMVTNASREGARAGIVYTGLKDSDGNYIPVDDGTIITIVNNYLRNNMLGRDYLINLGNPSVTTATTTITRAGGSPGGTLTVNVAYTYTFMVIPSFITSITNPITLTAQTVMRFE